MTDIVWEDPPARDYQGGSRPGSAMRLVDELKRHPGKWALAYSAARSTGASSYLKKLGCESQTRRNADGTTRVYARWPEDAP